MEIVNLPKPKGSTVEEKYEYAKFLMLCKEPTLQLLNFLDKEKDNFRYNIANEGPDYVFKLIWSKGKLPSEIKRTGVLCGISPYDSFLVQRYTGFPWANSYERGLLESAVDRLIEICGERSQAEAERKKKKENEQQRFFLKVWLDDHEKI